MRSILAYIHFPNTRVWLMISCSPVVSILDHKTKPPHLPRISELFPIRWYDLPDALRSYIFIFPRNFLWCNSTLGRNITCSKVSIPTWAPVIWASSLNSHKGVPRNFIAVISSARKSEFPMNNKEGKYWNNSVQLPSC